MSKPPEPHRATETMVVSFESDHHRALHQILISAGFTFAVSAGLRVGRAYEHPKKPVKVWLEDDDDNNHLDFKTEYRGEIQTDRQYSPAEWNWLTAPDMCTTEGVVETLHRELHILLNVRPRSMNVARIAGGL